MAGCTHLCTGPGRRRAWSQVVAIIMCLTLCPEAPGQTSAVRSASSPAVLFIRGGPGTGGFLEGGHDDQLSSISDYVTSSGNHGWGWLADTLRAEGFTLTELREEPVNDGVPTPIPFGTMDLSMYDVIVLASNNADYDSDAVDAMEAFVHDGGGLLVISDANFGQGWPDAPTSDQAFLDRFGLTMNQDRGTYAISSEDFVAPTHPIFTGVEAFDGEGVSPITVGTSLPAGVIATILARAKQQVRRNDTASGQGSSEPATEHDAALVAVTAGSGRLVGHFDRNTFFNENGAGTDLTRYDNAQLAKNIFKWLAYGDALPVELTHFDGITDGRAVLLTWRTASETNNAGFEVQQRTASVFEPVGYVEGYGTTTDEQRYSFSVPDLPPGRHVFRLKQIDFDGSFAYSPEVAVTVLADHGYHISPPWPHPVRQGAHVDVTVTTSGHVRIVLYDVLGRWISDLHNGALAPGIPHRFQIPTAQLTGGMYVVHVTSERFSDNVVFVYAP